MDLIYIRASSFAELFDCPARWEAKHIKKMRLPSSPASILGNAVHTGTAAYDLANMHGKPISLDDASTALVEFLANPKEDIDWEDSSPQEVECTALSLLRLYCDSPAAKLDYIAVELTCDNLLIDGLDIVLTGTTDRVYRHTDGRLGILDIKTGKTAVSSDGSVKVQKHVGQIGCYEILASTLLHEPISAPALIAGLQAGKTAKGQRFGLGKIEGAIDLLIGQNEEYGLLENAATLIRSGLFFGNPSSVLCTAKYCPAFNTCKYKK